jgi:hypothetical protein
MIGNPLLLADDGYQISRSVRLRSSASGYFNRTPGSAGNRKTWTWSGWVKRGGLGARQTLFSVFDYLASPPTNNQTVIEFTASDTLGFFQFSTSTYNGQKTTTQVFRDPSAWYHIVAIWDTTQATASNRMRLFVNGVQITAFGTSSDPSLNADGEINRAVLHNIGTFYDPDFGAPSINLDGYLTEVNFVDGQALTPSAFGETDAITGVWKPKKYTGTYGTNGFYLNFSDPSAASASAIGKDYSGNGNNWTPNNISVTSGSTYDSMLDVPTLWADGGNGRGNYAVLNPLTARASYASTTDGNLRANFVSGANASFVLCNTFQSSGKWYCEAQIVSTGADSTRPCVGVVKSSFDWNSIAINLGDTSDSYAYQKNGNKRTAGSSSSYGSSYTAGDIIGIALDMDAGTVVFYKNGTSQGTAFSGLSGDLTFAASGYADGTTRAIDFNFGQRPFAYTPPSGFKALHTGNLPEPVIKKPNQWFDVDVYTGNGATRNRTGFAFQPDFIWNKIRSQAYDHNLVDSVRGPTLRLQSNSTGAESTLANGITSFNSDGYSLGSYVSTNGSGESIVNWLWKEGATPGFDIVTYTGTGVAGRTVAHSLGVAPAMYILKNRGTTSNWPVYHKNANANPQNGGLYLNATDAFITASGFWNNTAPTSSVFSTGAGADTNANGNTYVAYLFAEVAGFSKFGSYTGNGSADGPFVFCGFRPRWVMIKVATGTTGEWIIFDTSRDTSNVTSLRLFPSTSNAESSSATLDILASGFKLRTSGQWENQSSCTYIFAAFAETAQKFSLAR